MNGNLLGIVLIGRLDILIIFIRREKEEFKAKVPVRNERIIIHCNWKNSMFDYLCDSTVYLVLYSDMIKESSCFFLVLHTMVKISLSDYWYSLEIDQKEWLIKWSEETSWPHNEVPGAIKGCFFLLLVLVLLFLLFSIVILRLWNVYCELI